MKSEHPFLVEIIPGETKPDGHALDRHQPDVAIEDDQLIRRIAFPMVSGDGTAQTNASIKRIHHIG